MSHMIDHPLRQSSANECRALCNSVKEHAVNTGLLGEFKWHASLPRNLMRRCCAQLYAKLHEAHPTIFWVELDSHECRSKQ